jgi:hypothetical protein
MSDEVDYTPVTPPGAEQPAQTISTVDSDALLNELPKGSPERKAVFGESEPDTPLSIEEAAARLRERRTKDADLVRYSDEARPRSDKQAAADLTFTKRSQRSANIAADFPGVGDPIAQAIEIERGGRIHAYPLSADEKSDPLAHGDTIEQATSRLTQMREDRIREIQQIMAQQLPPEAPAEAAAPSAEQQQSEPQSPEPPPPDLIEQERARVRQEAEALASMRNMSAQEIQLGFKAAELDRLATQQWGARIAQAGGLENLAKQDPQAARQVMEAKAAYDQLVAQSLNYQQMRQANEVLLQNTRAAELARVNRVEGEKAATEFTKYVEARDSQWKSDPDYRQSLQKMAVDIVEEVSPGSSAAIQRGEMYVTVGQQKALYDIARQRLSDIRVKESMASGRQKAQADLPKVHRPGVALSKSEISAADQSAQLNRLPYMSGQDAARAGARLLAERRGRR